MITYTNEKTYTSTLLESIPKLIHGFTTKKQGDLGNIDSAREYLKRQHIASFGITFQKQIHSKVVHTVKVSEIGSIIPLTDGLVYQNLHASIPVTLVVRVADCVPILLVDPDNDVIGVAHSGWRGTLGHITSTLVKSALSLGANASSMRVVIGPSICSSCYIVDEERATSFSKEFKNVAYYQNDHWHIDLGKAIKSDVTNAGIPNDHIDGDVTLCTFEQTDRFYSYRRKNDKFGEIIGYIGYK